MLLLARSSVPVAAVDGAAVKVVASSVEEMWEWYLDCRMHKAKEEVNEMVEMWIRIRENSNKVINF